MPLRLFARCAVLLAVFAGCPDSRDASTSSKPRSSQLPALAPDGGVAEGGAHSPPTPQVDAGEPTRDDDPARAVPPKPPAGPANDASVRDASEPDAAAARAGAGSPLTSPPSLLDDAGTGPDAAGANGGTPDSGSPDNGGPAIPPRTDGCPEDAPLPLNRVRVRAAAGQGALTVGAKLQGSNAGPTTDFVDLATLATAPADGAFAELEFANTQLYRYLRYYAPPGSAGSVAELEFYSGARRLEGDSFGTPSPNAGETFASAFDGDATTSFAPAANGGGYAGLDIARGYVTAAVSFTPDGTNSALPLQIELQSATADSVIHYTTDGSEPSATNGTTYTTPIVASAGRTELRAAASARCSFDSPVTTATYTVGQTAPVSGGLKSYHLGNSLTDTINRWLEPIADSTGVDHVYARWTIPGAPIKWLAEHQGEGF